MGTFLTILVLASAFLAFVAGISALLAGLRLRRTHLALRSHFYSEVVRLTGRATELEKNLTALDARAQALPVRISELQQNLATLRILTTALGTSLRQARRVLSPNGIGALLASPLAGGFGTSTERSGPPAGDDRRGKGTRP